jgi:hypothetical protein
MTRKLNDGGQTLIALLIFMMLAIMLTSAAVAITIINTQTNTGYMNGELALSNAESGAENALLKLERDPTYSSETMNMVDGNSTGTATITVSGTTTKTIISVGTVGNYRRTVTVTASDTANQITVTNWSETP